MRSNPIKYQLEDFWGPQREHLSVKELVAHGQKAYRETLDAASEIFHGSHFQWYLQPAFTGSLFLTASTEREGANC
jgi:hypothetical protein